MLYISHTPHIALHNVFFIYRIVQTRNSLVNITVSYFLSHHVQAYLSVPANNVEFVWAKVETKLYLHQTTP